MVCTVPSKSVLNSGASRHLCLATSCESFACKVHAAPKLHTGAPSLPNHPPSDTLYIHQQHFSWRSLCCPAGENGGALARLMRAQESPVSAMARRRGASSCSFAVPGSAASPLNEMDMRLPPSSSQLETADQRSLGSLQALHMPAIGGSMPLPMFAGEQQQSLESTSNGSAGMITSPMHSLSSLPPSPMVDVFWVPPTQAPGSGPSAAAAAHREWLLNLWGSSPSGRPANSQQHR